jgi:hypothetical protein
MTPFENLIGLVVSAVSISGGAVGTRVAVGCGVFVAAGVGMMVLVLVGVGVSVLVAKI